MAVGVGLLCALSAAPTVNAAPGIGPTAPTDHEEPTDPPGPTDPPIYVIPPSPGVWRLYLDPNSTNGASDTTSWDYDTWAMKDRTYLSPNQSSNQWFSFRDAATAKRTYHGAGYVLENTAKIDMNAMISVKVRWVGNRGGPASDKPPGKVGARISFFHRANKGPNSKISDGFGKTATDGPSFGGGELFLSGTHTFPPVDARGGGEVELGSFSPSIQDENTTDVSNQSVGVKAEIYVGELQLEDRSVTINRGGAKRKGDPGVTIDEDKDEWIDEDGTGHGHTIYSSKTRRLMSTLDPTKDLTVVSPNPNKVTFGARHGGGWGSDLTFQWTPSSDGTGDEASDTIDSHQQIMPDGGMTYDVDKKVWEGTPNDGSEEKNISYELTDNGTTPAIKETARYNLTLHDEWEVKEVIRDDGRVVIARHYPSVVDSSNPIYNRASPPKPKPAKYARTEEANATDEYSYKETKDAKIGISAGIDASKSALGPFLSKAGIDLSVKGDANIAVASEAKATELNKKGFSYSVEPSIDIPAGQYTKPKINVWAYRKVYRLRHWNAGGFAGDSEMVVTTFDSFEPRWEDLKDLPSNEDGPETGDPS